jgi:hypothetical protein
MEQGLLAATNTLQPGFAVMGVSTTQVTDAAAGLVLLGIVDVDLTGYTACKTISGTYTTGDPVRIARDGIVRAKLTTGAGATLTAGAPLICAGAGLLETQAAASTATTYGVVAKLMEEYTTANAITNVLVKIL